MGLPEARTYSAFDGTALRADLYPPVDRSAAKQAAVVLVHGGGWTLGDRKMMEPLALEFAAQGFLAITVQYRLVTEAAWPAQRDDVVAAIDWVAVNAPDWGVDPGKVIVVGSSVGAQLAMLAVGRCKAPGIAALVSLHGVSELTLDAEPSPGAFGAAAILGSDASDEALELASPLHQIGPAFPPTFLIHGGSDWLIAPVAPVRVYQALAAAGVSVELHIVAKAHHEFASEPQWLAPITSEMTRFIDRVLMAAEQWDQAARQANIFAQGPEALAELVENLGK